jgi:hypothetical protein
MVEAAPGDDLGAGAQEESLILMRTRMLQETRPRAWIFVGGMDGIDAECSC